MLINYLNDIIHFLFLSILILASIFVVNLNLAYLIENIVTCTLLYAPGLNTAFGFRAIIFRHWCPCLGMWICFLIYSETVKYLIRNVKEPDGSKGFWARYYSY